jgi:hypothetical protein
MRLCARGDSGGVTGTTAFSSTGCIARHAAWPPCRATASKASATNWRATGALVASLGQGQYGKRDSGGGTGSHWGMDRRRDFARQNDRFTLDVRMARESGGSLPAMRPKRGQISRVHLK